MMVWKRQLPLNMAILGIYARFLECNKALFPVGSGIVGDALETSNLHSTLGKNIPTPQRQKTFQETTVSNMEKDTPLKTNMTLENLPFSIGHTSSFMVDLPLSC